MGSFNPIKFQLGCATSLLLCSRYLTPLSFYLVLSVSHPTSFSLSCFILFLTLLPPTPSLPPSFPLSRSFSLSLSVSLSLSLTHTHTHTHTHTYIHTHAHKQCYHST